MLEQALSPNKLSRVRTCLGVQFARSQTLKFGQSKQRSHFASLQINVPQLFLLAELLTNTERFQQLSSLCPEFAFMDLLFS